MSVGNSGANVRRAVVTGASSGIGAATVRRLRSSGWEVIAVARRAQRLKELARETGAAVFAADITIADDVARLVEFVDEVGGAQALINNAGGALGVESVAEADIDKWQRMYEVNVIGTLRLTREMLPMLRSSGRGDVVIVTSTAAHDTYPGGGGYVAAKHAERIIATTLRQELVGEPVRIMEIAPGMVHTEEFSLTRYGGDQTKADAVYEGVSEPLVAEDIADVIEFMVSRPHHVNLDSVIVRPRAQATNTVVARTDM
ncbi:MAG TPA: SDR family oxidoreductase [Actinomycetales bacterium]|nr:SDR family oxidoreductase [Actinomycetales bacterium]